VSNIWSIPACANNGCTATLSNLTFDGALSGSSGNSVCAAMTKLFQQAIANLLNNCRATASGTTCGATSSFDPRPVICDVQQAIDTCDRTTILNKANFYQSLNTGICP
jgi:hypothetical protein